MERTIYDIMSDSPLKVAEFINACDEMLNTQYILADGRVEAILKSIATSKVLYSLFGKILLKFDYKSMAKSCIRSGCPVMLPSLPEDTAALVFCLLVDIDKHNIELKDFLRFYRQEQDSALAYKYFLKDFIAPFKSAVVTLIQNDKKAADEKRKNEKRETERRRLESNFDKFMGTLVARINSDDNLDALVKDRLTVMCGAFADAVHKDNTTESKNTYQRLIQELRLHMPPLAKELERFDINS